MHKFSRACNAVYVHVKLFVKAWERDQLNRSAVFNVDLQHIQDSIIVF